MKTTNLIVIIIVLALVLAGGYYLYTQMPADLGTGQVATTTADGTSTSTSSQGVGGVWAIGTSTEGRVISAYQYGSGDTEVLFVGGIHGGYSWNTALVAYRLMDYLTENPQVIPAKVKVTVIPVLNPDGLNKIVGTAGRFSPDDVTQTLAQSVPGRFNAATVDLNRNFDCDWKATGTWQNTSVSGGSAAFSEPESKALKAYVEASTPSAVVVWYSSAGGVYSSSCNNGILAETSALTKAYASASGYPAHDSFDAYATSGDLPNWLAKMQIPAISVLLTNHTDIEWDKNQKGVGALLSRYAQ